MLLSSSTALLFVGTSDFTLCQTLAPDELQPLFDDAWTGSHVWPASHLLSRVLVRVYSSCSTGLPAASGIPTREDKPPSNAEAAPAVDPYSDGLQLIAQEVRSLTDTYSDERSRVLELGSGTGLCGLVCAALGMDVVLSDQAMFLDLLTQNVELNIHLLKGNVQVCTLDWSNKAHFEALCGPCLQDRTDKAQTRFDVVVVSDCLNPVYGMESIPLLAKAILRVVHAESRVYLAYEERGRGDVLQMFIDACDDKLCCTTIATEGPRSVFYLSVKNKGV
ncbi:hypothetical protein SARC_03234 [Sphaeroforma arctica JP610]|uniref:Uncharacterized protein n=1 Tax=Sphaeroforma arctica JP610 TaxID=667725 RepID=A0A0L0G6T2_9EUKA|nr:hypothetical protein SARC_03234 [Sphaeroforma arctica JP610]KNC84561.1 hypothetical protein SARC_03234 [Sphaeroforma arctica JP610]|eukprot:XP_014158463.1 hypothetical protein SARC_03234 [Sphaeroforma arctica JP610]